jgi:phospholipid-binding lipoprotein MlaA
MGIVALEKRAELVDQEQLIEDSFDNYEFVKNAYFQNMRYKVYDGDPPIEEIEEFDDELEEYMDEFDEIDDYDEAID